jgi:pimeloyl-ACP methyl ester carboxylesterase
MINTARCCVVHSPPPDLTGIDVPHCSLLCRLAWSGEQDCAGPAGPGFDDAVLFVHGFPDLAVDPVSLEHGSRFCRKLCDAVLDTTPTSTSRLFCAFNSSGLPGSDDGVQFEDKLLSREVIDVLAVASHLRTACRVKRLHILGLSTGAILAALLRSRPELRPPFFERASITVVAGLLDAAKGVCQYDFDRVQMTQFSEQGWCWKEFWLPPGLAPKALESAVPTTASSDPDCWGKVVMRLNRSYIDDARALSVQASVASTSIPFLVIHGEADANIPVSEGVGLYDAAAEPKQLCLIPKANHLFTSTAHFKKLIRAFLDHIANSSV